MQGNFESLFGQDRRHNDGQEEYRSLYELYTERRKGTLPTYADKKIENFVKGPKLAETLLKSDVYGSIAKFEQSNTSPAGYVAVLAEQLTELDSLLDTIMKPVEKQVVAERLGGMGDSLKSLQKKL